VVVPAVSNTQDQIQENLITMDVKHFREYIVRPTLKLMDEYIPGMWSDAAENLMVGTALMESDIAYLVQHNGPALGVYQIEPATHEDIMGRYIYESKFSTSLISILDSMLYYIDEEKREDTLANDYLVFDLRYATIVARIKYFMSPIVLPNADNIHALGHYWNDYYNGNPDVGTADQWEVKYRKAHKLWE
jgi:hypothetical protein